MPATGARRQRQGTVPATAGGPGDASADRAGRAADGSMLASACHHRRLCRGVQATSSDAVIRDGEDATSDPIDQPAAGTRTPEQVSLPEFDAEVAEFRRLCVRLDALGDEVAASPQRKGGETRNDRPAKIVALDAVDDADIDLRVCRPQFDDVAQARVARTRVVNGKPHVAKCLQGLAKGDVVVDRDVFRQLDHESSWCCGDRLEERRRAIDDQSRRDVEGEVWSDRQLRRLKERGADRGELELLTESDRASLGESEIGPHAIVEPGQRLVADDDQRSQVDDRLEHRLELSRAEDVLQPDPRVRRVAQVSEPRPDEGAQHARVIDGRRQQRGFVGGRRSSGNRDRRRGTAGQRPRSRRRSAHRRPPRGPPPRTPSSAHHRRSERCPPPRGPRATDGRAPSTGSAPGLPRRDARR